MGLDVVTGYGFFLDRKMTVFLLPTSFTDDPSFGVTGPFTYKSYMSQISLVRIFIFVLVFMFVVY